jgi:hypothetical protein
MSLLDRVRLWPSVTEETGPPAPRWQLVGGGLVAALSSWAVVAVLGLLAWLASPQSQAGLGETLGVATAVWFLGTGGRVVASGVPFEVVPLGCWALAVWLTSLALRHTLRLAHQGTADGKWPATLVRQVLPLFAAGYAVPVLVFALAGFAGPARPTLAGLLGAFTVPLGAVLLVALRPDEPEAEVIDRALEPVPLWLRRSVGPGLWGAACLLGAGTLVVLAALVWRFDVVLGLHQSVDPGWVGGAVLLLAQLAYLPTFGVWGLAWLAGPGFDVAAGATVTVSGSQPGLLPLVPVLGAVPPEGSYSPWLATALLAPVLVGVIVGWRGSRAWTRLANWRLKARTAGTAVGVAVVVVAVLAVFASGAMGVDRLAAVGTSPLLVALALAGELALGAAGYVLVDAIRNHFFD